MVGRADEISDVLIALKTQGYGIRAAFLASRQGSFLGSSAITGSERVQLAGISAASVAIASKGIADLQLGQLGQIHIVGDAGSILLLRVGERAVLTLVAEHWAELPAVLAEARKAAASLAPLV